MEHGVGIDRYETKWNKEYGMKLKNLVILLPILLACASEGHKGRGNAEKEIVIKCEKLVRGHSLANITLCYTPLDRCYIYLHRVSCVRKRGAEH